MEGGQLLETRIRDAKDEDAAGIIALLAGVYAEYPGCVLDVDGEEPELRAIATTYRGLGGRMWVAARGDVVVGTAGWRPSREPGGIELRKLYLSPTLRGSGLAAELCDRVEADGRVRGASFVDLWSDTRFTRAHRFYERRGYVRGPKTRELHDKSASVELYFRLELTRA